MKWGRGIGGALVMSLVLVLGCSFFLGSPRYPEVKVLDSFDPPDYPPKPYVSEIIDWYLLSEISDIERDWIKIAILSYTNKCDYTNKDEIESRAIKEIKSKAIELGADAIIVLYESDSISPYPYTRPNETGENKPYPIVPYSAADPGYPAKQDYDYDKGVHEMLVYAIRYKHYKENGNKERPMPGKRLSLILLDNNRWIKGGGYVGGRVVLVAYSMHMLQCSASLPISSKPTSYGFRGSPVSNDLPEFEP